MVQGLRSFNKKMADLPRIMRDAANTQLEKEAEKLVQLMKRRAPVRTGDLRDSIGWTWGDPPKGATVFARTAPNAEDRRITVFAGGQGPGGRDVYWQWWVEFGAQSVPPQPYFFPSYRQRRRSITRNTTRAMKTAIQRRLK